MFIHLHFPDNLHLTIYSKCHCEHLHAHIGTLSTIFISIRVTLLPTQLATHLEKVRFLIPLCGLNVRHFFGRSGYPIRRICWRHDISTIWSLHNIFPRRFSFLLRSRKDKNKIRRQSRQSDSFQPYRKAELRNLLPSPSISRTYC